jgi:GDP-L-fucose synthase
VSLSSEFNDFLFFYVGREDADLTKEEEVSKLFDKIKPDYVIHAAARVGGIGRNLNTPAQQFRDNILMNTNIIHSSFLNNVQKLIVFSSACVFPADSEYLSEDIMHNSPPFDAHFAYAYAKRMADVQILAYTKQYGDLNYCSVIPSNIFGENDNYNLEDGHVIPSLIHKLYLAKKENKELICWGDGSSIREFIYSKDLALVCLKLLSSEQQMPKKLIVSGDNEHSIKEMVDKLCEVADYHKVLWDTSKPNGQKRRKSNKELFYATLPNFRFTNLEESLERSYNWFVENYNNTRK